MLSRTNRTKLSNSSQPLSRNMYNSLCDVLILEPPLYPTLSSPDHSHVPLTSLLLPKSSSSVATVALSVARVSRYLSVCQFHFPLTLFLCRYAALCSDMLEGNISVCKGAAAISSVGERVMICDTCVIYCYIPRLLVRLVARLPHYYLALFKLFDTLLDISLLVLKFFR